MVLVKNTVAIITVTLYGKGSKVEANVIIDKISTKRSANFESIDI